MPPSRNETDVNSAHLVALPFQSEAWNGCWLLRPVNESAARSL